MRANAQTDIPPDGPSLPRSSCQLTKRAMFPLRESGRHFAAPLTVNGQTLSMVVDTGADRTTLAPYLADVLGLQANNRERVVVHGVGGISAAAHPMMARSVQFGPSQWSNLGLMLGDIARSDRGLDPEPPVGLIGADLLSSYDIEFDFPNHQMTLYSTVGCSGDFVPWPASHQRFEAIRTLNTFMIPVALNRHPVLALIDTGAAASSLASAGAVAAGIDLSTLEQDRTGTSTGVNGRSVKSYHHRFDTMVVGSTGFKNVLMSVQDSALGGADMLLGLDFLRWRKVWVSYATNQIFLQYLPPKPAQPAQAPNAYNAPPPRIGESPVSPK